MTADSGPQEATPEEPQLYPIQLVDVYCLSSEAERSDPEPDAEGAEGPQSSLAVESLHSGLSEDGLSFGARLKVDTVFRLPDGPQVKARVTVQGYFVSETRIDQALYDGFVEQTPLVLLWPYARAYLSQLGALLAVPMPPLPTLPMPHPPVPET